jgi:hypothetical protein
MNGSERVRGWSGAAITERTVRAGIRWVLVPLVIDRVMVREEDRD